MIIFPDFIVIRWLYFKFGYMHFQWFIYRCDYAKAIYNSAMQYFAARLFFLNYGLEFIIA